jgi:aspartate aminotransferase
MARVVSQMASGLVGSEILKIAADVNRLKKEGHSILNFTVGDFDPAHFPIPTRLAELTTEALRDGQTNYPPATGVEALRESVARFYQRELGFDAQPSEILIASGARPLIYATFGTVVEPGDAVVYPLPSWNNNHYVHLFGAQGVTVTCRADRGFLPTLEELRPHLRTARLLCLNSPLNPTGTMFSEAALHGIADALVEENARRAGSGERPLFLMYDQIYWKLAYRGARHVHPLALRPELRPWTVFIDGISKYFCATGLRVGWAFVPKEISGPYANLVGHMGAWAPKPEQAAVARFLDETKNMDAYVSDLGVRAGARLNALYDGVMALKARGLPIDAIAPQGAIYLSLRIGPLSRDGRPLTDEQTRRLLLEQAGVAVVPFQAFGLTEDTGWFRLSIGAVSEADCRAFVERVGKLLG